MMFESNLPADIRSATLSFNLVWRAALKSDRFARRRRLIMRLRAATRPDAINKSIWSVPRRLVDVALLELLQWEMRLKKAAVFKQFAANGTIRTKANGV